MSPSVFVCAARELSERFRLDQNLWGRLLDRSRQECRSHRPDIDAPLHLARFVGEPFHARTASRDDTFLLANTDRLDTILLISKAYSLCKLSIFMSRLSHFRVS